jgi:succinyl-diaminopimelate desuccinylase
MVHGVQGHIAYPHLARNPIHAIAPALAELVATRWDEGNEYFDPTSFQISDVHAGTGTHNVIPGELEIAFNFRYAPVSSEDDLKARVRAVLDRHAVDHTLTWTLSGLPFLTPRGALVDCVRQVVRAVTGIEPALSTSGGTSDGRFLAGISREILEFGPSNESIHKANERIAIADLGPLSTIYERILESFVESSGTER